MTVTVADLQTKFSADERGLDRGIASANRKIQGFARNSGSSIGSVAGIAMGGLVERGVATAINGINRLASAGTGALTGATLDAADLNAQISAIAANASASAADVAPLKELIFDLGIDPKLKVSATDAAGAIDMLVRNGMQIPDIMEGAARSTILLSNSTGGDFATSADIATDVMAIWGIQANEMATAVNGITSVVTNSKFSINDYALAIAQGGGVAGAVGVEFEDFNTTIAAISPLFGSGSDAGTSFKTFLQRLVPSSNAAADEMARLGLLTEEGNNQFFDAAGNMRSMAEIAGLLNNAFSDLSEEQRNNALSTIFGTDAMRAAAGLAKLTEEEFRNLQETMGNTDAERSAAERMNNLAGDMEIFKGVVETLTLQVGDKFQPAMREFFQGLSPIVQRLTPQLVEIAGLLGDGLTALLPNLESINEAFIMPALDDFIGRLERARDMSSLALDVTGDGLTSFLAGLAEMTGGTVSVDVEAGIVEVDWGVGLFTHTYDAGAQITENSILWGAYTHIYEAGAEVTENRIGWGAWTHSYNASADIDEKSVGWGLYSHTYDASAQVNEGSIAWGLVSHTYDVGARVPDATSIFWGLFTWEYDVTGRMTNVVFADGWKMPDFSANVKVEKIIADQEATGDGFSFLEKAAIRFAPDVLDVLSNLVITAPPQSELGPLLTIPTPQFVWPDPPAIDPPEIPMAEVEEIPPFEWPELPGWEWPDLPDFEWPTLPRWVWPSLPSWEWPSIPRPGWVEQLINWRPTLPSWLGGGDGATEPGTNAQGTDYWRGGWTWVGEQGPELVNLPRGSQVLDNRTSMQMAGAGASNASTINVTVNANVSDKLDMEDMAYRIADVIRRRQR